MDPGLTWQYIVIAVIIVVIRIILLIASMGRFYHHGEGATRQTYDLTDVAAWFAG